MKEVEGRFVGIDLAKRSYVARLEPNGAGKATILEGRTDEKGIRKLCTALGREDRVAIECCALGFWLARELRRTGSQRRSARHHLQIYKEDRPERRGEACMDPQASSARRAACCAAAERRGRGATGDSQRTPFEEGSSDRAGEPAPQSLCPGRPDGNGAKGPRDRRIPKAERPEP